MVGLLLAASGLALLASACTQVKTPTAEPYISSTAPPQVQELRWSNGKLPKSFDPARASASPESDIVCSLFEGLTEIDPTTFNAVPALAEKWTSAEDARFWTFHLRKDAKWSNGKRVTAADIVASWKRAAAIQGSAHPELFENIVGLVPKPEPLKPAVAETLRAAPVEPKTASLSPETSPAPSVADEGPAPKSKIIGVTAVDDTTLTVSLTKADPDFPKLVSDPVFRPVYGEGTSFETSPLEVAIPTNGPFTLAEASAAGVVLARSESYWNKAAVKLERIRFVPTETAESALDAYKRGELDAITNSDFEPLALKLLSPYGDFRQTTHNALNLYEFNTKNAPFSDRRVREAMSIAIDRERLVESEFQGSAEPADDFVPIRKGGDGSLDFDVEYARDLLSRAGYANGESFPSVRLVINRNDAQQRVARIVARMWKQNLGIDTQVLVKDAMEIDAIRGNGEYDLIRRGVVLPTADERAMLSAIFIPAAPEAELLHESPPGPEGSLAAKPETHTLPQASEHLPMMDNETAATAAQALYQLYSIPLYSPTAYSLVKPYVHGLQITGLNSVSVRNISIDNTWTPPPRSGQP